MELSEFIINSGLLHIIILYLGILTGIYGLVKYQKDKKTKVYNQVKDKIIKAFENNLINTLNDIENIYSAITSKSNPDSQSLINVLQLSSIHFYENKLLENKSELIIKKINGFIDDINKKEPFSDLPLTERNILNNLLVYKEELSKDKESFTSKLHDLAHIVKIKYDENNEFLKKNNRNTKISYFIGIIGILVSIYFAINTTTSSTENINKNEQTIINK